MQLVYIGPDPGTGAIPLPEGWPAEDHDEPNGETAAAKVASGMYANLVETPQGSNRRGRKTDTTMEPADVSEIPPVDTDGIPGNGGFGTATGDPLGATPPQEG